MSTKTTAQFLHCLQGLPLHGPQTSSKGAKPSAIPMGREHFAHFVSADAVEPTASVGLSETGPEVVTEIAGGAEDI